MQQVILQQQRGRTFGHLGQEHFHLQQLPQEQSGHEQDGKMQQFLPHEIFLQQLERGHEQQHRHFGSGQQAHGLQLHGPQSQQRGISRWREHPSQQQQQIHEQLKQGIPLYHKHTYVIIGTNLPFQYCYLNAKVQ